MKKVNKNQNSCLMDMSDTGSMITNKQSQLFSSVIIQNCGIFEIILHVLLNIE